MLRSKKTWCPKCNGSIERIERFIGAYYREMWVIYKCDSCRYENITSIKITDKMRKRLKESRGGFGSRR